MQYSFVYLDPIRIGHQIDCLVETLNIYVWNFIETLTYNVVNFEQPAPDN